MNDDMMIGNPAEQADYWQLQVADDNCAVTAEMTLLNQFGINLNQEEAMYVSSSHGWYHPGGGTSPAYIGNLMDLYGVPNHTVMNANLSDLASELQQGHGVIVGVRSDQLWEQGPQADFWNFFKSAWGLDTSEFSPADHAVVVTGLDVSDADHPMVILNDSGDPNGQAHAYPLDRFMDAWENSDFFYTATDAAIPHDTDFINELQSLPFWKTFAQAAAGTYTFLNTGDIATTIAVTETTGQLVDSFFSDTNNIAML